MRSSAAPESPVWRRPGEFRDRNILVLEATDRVGGRIKSEPRGHFWLNFGTHVFDGAYSATR
jgi:protoporphyrinogen oxidase